MNPLYTLNIFNNLPDSFKNLDQCSSQPYFYKNPSDILVPSPSFNEIMSHISKQNLGFRLSSNILNSNSNTRLSKNFIDNMIQSQNNIDKFKIDTLIKPNPSLIRSGYNKYKSEKYDLPLSPLINHDLGSYQNHSYFTQMTSQNKSKCNSDYLSDQIAKQIKYFSMFGNYQISHHKPVYSNKYWNPLNGTANTKTHSLLYEDDLEEPLDLSKNPGLILFINKIKYIINIYYII